MDHRRRYRQIGTGIGPSNARRCHCRGSEPHRKFTGHGNGWTRAAVCSLRHQRGIAIYRDGERNERGEMTLDEAAQALNVSRSTVWRMIDEGVLPADHPCPGAPWLVQAKDIERADIQQDAKNRRSRRPLSHDPLQNQLDL